MSASRAETPAASIPDDNDDLAADESIDPSGAASPYGRNRTTTLRGGGGPPTPLHQEPRDISTDDDSADEQRLNGVEMLAVDMDEYYDSTTLTVVSAQERKTQ
jgi:hypothetical protein